MPVKRVMKRAPARPVEDEDNGDAPAPVKSATKKAAAPVKKAAAKKAAAPRATPAGDETETPSVRGGWTASQETIDATSPWAASLKITTQAQIVKFLGASPYAAYRRHWIDRVGVGRRAYVCLESVNRPCPLCDVGDRPQAVSAFNIALIGDDGEATVKSWDCGVKITQVLKTFANDPKVGPLSKPNLYFAVSKSETTQRQQTQTMVVPVRSRDMKEDYGVEPLDEEEIERLVRKGYTNDIVEIPRTSELQEVADEMLNEDGGSPSSGGGWGS